jgi:hypothetical protein
MQGVVMDINLTGFNDFPLQVTKEMRICLFSQIEK